MMHLFQNNQDSSQVLWSYNLLVIGQANQMVYSSRRAILYMSGYMSTNVDLCECRSILFSFVNVA